MVETPTEKPPRRGPATPGGDGEWPAADYPFEYHPAPGVAATAPWVVETLKWLDVA